MAADIHTVYNFLEARDALEVLADEDIGTAIMAVSSSEGGVQRSRAELEADSSNKQVEILVEMRRETYDLKDVLQKAIRSISERYANDKISKEDIEYCLFSMGDFHAYLETNRRPVLDLLSSGDLLTDLQVDEMIALLQANFDPNKAENPYSLEICSGLRGKLPLDCNEMTSHCCCDVFLQGRSSLTLILLSTPLCCNLCSFGDM